jgi:hypothetical protein
VLDVLTPIRLVKRQCGWCLIEHWHCIAACLHSSHVTQDALGIIKRVGELAEANGVSIHAILQNPIEDRDNVDFVVTTEPCRLSQASQLLHYCACSNTAVPD